MKKTEETNELIVLEEVKYPVNTDEIQAFLAEFKDVPNIDPDSEDASELYQIVLKGHKRAVKFRTSIEKKRKELKAPALEYGKKVDEVAKEFQSLVSPKEEQLFIQRKKVEDNEQRKQDELIAIERKRVDDIDKKITQLKMIPLDSMGKNSDELKIVYDGIVIPTEDVFEERFEESMMVYKETISKLENAILTTEKSEQADKIYAEQEEKRKGQERLAEIERQKERDALAKEREDFEIQKQEQERAMREQQEEINRQNAEREAEEQAKREEQERAMREQQSKEQYEAKIKESLDCMNKYTDTSLLLNEIVAGAIPNIKWVG